jgi:hypothetical protein
MVPVAAEDGLIVPVGACYKDLLMLALMKRMRLKVINYCDSVVDIT